jgi:hypothetical protein
VLAGEAGPDAADQQEGEADVHGADAEAGDLEQRRLLVAIRDRAQPDRDDHRGAVGHDEDERADDVQEDDPRIHAR